MMVSVLEYFELKKLWLDLYEQNDVKGLLKLENDLLAFEEKFCLVPTRPNKKNNLLSDRQKCKAVVCMKPAKKDSIVSCCTPEKAAGAIVSLRPN